MYYKKAVLFRQLFCNFKHYINTTIPDEKTSCSDNIIPRF
jgi:hypothetical protein